MRLFFFFALQAFLQGIAKICEGEGRKVQVRSLRYGVEGSAQVSLLPIHPPNPMLSGPIGQAGLARIQLLLGSSHQLDACSPSSDDPLPADCGWEMFQDRSHIWAGHSCLQPNSSSAWPAVLVVTVPFQGCGPYSPAGELITLSMKLWAPNFSSSEAKCSSWAYCLGM